MAILKIARMGHPVLSRPADPVEDPTAPEVRQLVHDMIETMEDAGGTGLAAPQVHVPKRVVVFFVSAARAQREDVTARLEEASADAGARSGSITRSGSFTARSGAAGGADGSRPERSTIRSSSSSPTNASTSGRLSDSSSW